MDNLTFGLTMIIVGMGGTVATLGPTPRYPPKERKVAMASEVLKLTAQIVISHASMTELSTEEILSEIKEIYNVLAWLGGGTGIEEPEQLKGREASEVKKPPIPLRDIVKAKSVVCLECGKKMRTLKAHLRKAHNLMPKEYFKRYGLDSKKYPLVCKEYSEQRRKLAIDKGLGDRLRRKAAKPA